MAQGSDKSAVCRRFGFERDPIVMNYIYRKCLAEGVQPTEKGLEEFLEAETGCVLTDKSKLPSRGPLEIDRLPFT